MFQFFMSDAFSELPAFRIDAAGVVTHWNEACCRATGIEGAKIIGKKEAWRAFWAKPKKILAERIAENAECLKENNFIIKLSDNCVCTVVPVDRQLGGKNAIWSVILMEKGQNGNIKGCWQIFKPIIIENLVLDKRLLQVIIDKFPIPVALLIDNKLAITNDDYASLLGVKNKNELVGKHVSDFIDESDRQRFMDANKNGHQGIVSGASYCWKYKINGQIKYLLGRPSVIKVGDKMALLSTVRDISSQILHEQKLEKDKQNLAKEKEELLKIMEKHETIYLGKATNKNDTFAHAAQMARLDANLVILGETGTGKSLLARIIHNISQRKNRPFVMVNCSAIPENLFESAFFGHVRGAFTGADQTKKGFLEQAHGGTLFLDEVGELTLAMQAKLLHAVELGKYTPVGSVAQKDVDVRLICATNRNLQQMLNNGTFREDFFYRIFVTYVRLPPLRERKDELPDLIKFFLDKFSPPGESIRVSSEIMTMLLNYDWPGNIRELQNVILRYLALGEIQLFPAKRKSQAEIADEEDAGGRIKPLATILKQAERKHILRALRLCDYNKALAAKTLGMNLRTFHRRCAEFHFAGKFAGQQ